MKKIQTHRIQTTNQIFNKIYINLVRLRLFNISELLVMIMIEWVMG